MDAGQIALIGGITTTVLAGLFTVVAAKATPKVEKNSIIADDALKFMNTIQAENERLRTENQQLRRRLEEKREGDD